MSVTQNETGGRDLLLKVAIDLTAAVAGTSSWVCAAHGLAVGDVVQFGEDEGTVIDDALFYFVNTVPDGSHFTVAATPGGVSLVPNATDATVALVGYKTVGGLRTKSFAFSADGIDITNHDSTEWANILDGAGIRKVSASGEGVFTNNTYLKAIQTAAFTNALKRLMFVDVKSGWIFQAYFKITGLEMGGGYDAEGTYKMSAESSGAVSTQQPA